MIARFLILSFMVLFVVPISFAQDDLEKYKLDRVTKSKIELQKHKQLEKQLSSEEFYLFSLNPPITREQLVAKTSTYGVAVKGAYICYEGGGVAAFHFDDQQNLLKQFTNLEAVALSERSNQRYGRMSGSTVEARSNVKMKSEIMYCGFDAHLEFPKLDSLQSSLGANLVAIEVTTKKMRRLPINWSK